jgi:hypothetical protein
MGIDNDSTDFIDVVYSSDYGRESWNACIIP